MTSARASPRNLATSGRRCKRARAAPTSLSSPAIRPRSVRGRVEGHASRRRLPARVPRPGHRQEAGGRSGHRGRGRSPLGCGLLACWPARAWPWTPKSDRGPASARFPGHAGLNHVAGLRVRRIQVRSWRPHRSPGEEPCETTGLRPGDCLPPRTASTSVREQQGTPEPRW
jgi:hypothetical protein